jgi:hypothetical protein
MKEEPKALTRNSSFRGARQREPGISLNNFEISDAHLRI